MTKELYKYKGGDKMSLSDRLDYVYFILRDYMCSGLSEKALKRRYKAVHPDTIKHILYSKDYECARNQLTELNRIKFENKFRKETL